MSFVNFEPPIFRFLDKLFKKFKVIKFKNISPTVLKRTPLFFLFLFVFGLFVFSFTVKNERINPNLQLKKLASSHKILPLVNWNARLSFCENVNSKRTCTHHATEVPVSFPLKNSLEKWRNANSEKIVNSVQLTLPLTLETKLWIADIKTISFAMPRSVQELAWMRVDDEVFETQGTPMDIAFNIEGKKLQKMETLKLSFDFSGYEFPGSTTLPPAFLPIEHLNTYLNLPNQQEISTYLSKQLEVGLPVVVAAMAVVLDHSRTFAHLAVYAAARSARALLADFPEGHSAGLTNVIYFLICALSGLTIPLFMQFANTILFDSKYSKSKVLISCLVCFFGTGSVVLFDKSFLLSVDLWTDLVSCLVVFCMICVKFVNVVREKTIVANDKTAEIFNTTKALQFERMGILAFCVAAHGYGEFTDILSVFPILASFKNSVFSSGESANVFKSFLDWNRQILMPGCLTAALLDVGSISKKILSVKTELQEKARIEKEKIILENAKLLLEAQKAILDKDMRIGKEVQSRLLPRKKHSTKEWAWKSYYKPAQALAGDWYDVQEIEFKQLNDDTENLQSRPFLALCLVDMTGHGVGPSLATSVLCSAWHSWCKNISNLATPSSSQQIEFHVSSAAKNLNNALLNLPHNEEATAVVALIDAKNSAVTLSFCGHPGIIISNGSEFQFAKTVGERLGVAGSENIEWEAKTFPFDSNANLFFYTDGLLPPGKTPGAWVQMLKRQSAKEKINAPKVILTQFRANRKFYRNNHEAEDDITLVIVKNVGESENGDLELKNAG